MVAPALAHQRMAGYENVMRSYASAMADTWRPGQSLDIVAEMMRLTLAIVCRTLFDVEMVDQAEAIGRDVMAAQTYAMRQMRVPFRLPQGKARAALARLNETIYGIIRERRSGLADNGDLAFHALADSG